MFKRGDLVTHITYRGKMVVKIRRKRFGEWEYWLESVKRKDGEPVSQTWAFQDEVAKWKK